jgi:AsmA family/AsmA-like C-terminal region
MAAVAAMLLVLFLFRPGVRQLRNRISTSIGSALGRRVTIENVRLHLLPRPAFDLSGLVIYDDPIFSAEPMIRAQDVSAAIRLRSLLWGRIEISTLSAAEPSINIVRDNDGRWNLANLLVRNAQIPAAPTQKPASERRPAFPYLEATHARINFKIGQAKKSLALTDANVALWQESDNSWGARLRAQPVRTDLNLTDTGQIQVNATWRRAENLSDTPMQVSIGWQNGQLGQITQLITGDDQGWRGSVDLSASLAGTPETLIVQSRIGIEGFRRYNVLDTRNVHLATTCTGTYSVGKNALTGLLCESPVGGGVIRLRGGIQGLTLAERYDLTLMLQRVSLASVGELWHKIKQQLPADLGATGTFNGVFHAKRDSASPAQLSGLGAASNVRLVSNDETNLVVLADVPVALISDARCCGRSRIHTSGPADGIHKDSAPQEAHLRIGPSPLVVNSGSPLNAGGWISAAGYHFFVRGDTDLKTLFRLEDSVGIAAAHPAAEGEVKLDLSLAGPWHGLPAPVVVGSAQLHYVHGEMRGLNTPIEISSASLAITPDEVHFGKISARLDTTHLSGEVTTSRRCAISRALSAPTFSIGSVVPECVFRFDLAADSVSSAELVEWTHPHPAKRPWYRLLSPDEPRDTASLLRIQASGDLHVGRFLFKKLVATQVSSHAEIHDGRITLADIRAELLQGRYQGRWSIDASRQPAACQGSGSFEDISLSEVGALMDDSWVTGTGDGTFKLDGSGATLPDLLSNSVGSLSFVMRNGAFTHVEFPGTSTPLAVHRFSGELQLKKGSWGLSDGRLESRDGFYRVSGTASPGNALDFIFTRSDDRTWKLTGPLAKPRVSQVPTAEMSREDASSQTPDKL